MNPTKSSTPNAATTLSPSTAPTRRWGAWVAGVAAVLALVSGCAERAPEPARDPAADALALNDRLDAIEGRTAAMRDKIAAMKAKREKILSTEVPVAKQPKQPKAPKQPKPPKQPHVTPPDDDGSSTGPIVIDAKCNADPIGCLKR